jgi:hypothetical protein
MLDRDDRGQPLPLVSTIVLFAVLAPFFAVCPNLVFILLETVENAAWGGIFLLTSYLFGIAPAALAGLAIALLSRAYRKGWQLLPISLLVGGGLMTAGALVVVMLAPSMDYSIVEGLSFAGVYGLGGFICAALVVWMRSRRTKRKLPSPS